MGPGVVHIPMLPGKAPCSSVSGQPPDLEKPPLKVPLPGEWGDDSFYRELFSLRISLPRAV